MLSILGHDNQRIVACSRFWTKNINIILIDILGVVFSSFLKGSPQATIYRYKCKCKDNLSAMFVFPNKDFRISPCDIFHPKGIVGYIWVESPSQVGLVGEGKERRNQPSP